MNAGWGISPRISWNPVDFNPHEIWWISPVKSGRFQIPWAFAWWSSIGLSFFERLIRRGFAETSDWSFSRKTYTWVMTQKLTFMKSGRFHHRNLVDFTLKYGGFHEIHEIWQDFTMKSGRFHLWNPPKIHKSAADVSAKTLQIWWMQGLGTMTRDFRWNLPDFTWNLADFTWNPLDFMKSASISYGFHEIWQISWNPWNLADFSMKSGGFQVKSDVSEISCRCFSKNSSDFTRFGVDFTWNLPDFMKSTRFHLKSTGFHEICWISYGFHEIHEIWQISHHEIWQISGEIQMFQKSAADVSAKTLLIFTRFGVDFRWNLPDFHEICQISPEIHWISWNLPDFIQIS